MTAPKVIRFRGGFDYIYKTTGSAADLLDKLEFDELKNTLVIFNHGTKTYNKSKNNTNNQNSSSN